ncbi:MAG: MarR family transcriptional regulator [Ferruginibacter sp.]
MNSKEMPETLGFMIVHTGKMLLRSINGTFACFTNDITFEQMGVLYYISRNTGKDLIQQDIAEIMDKPKSSILRNIDILEEKGFVKRLSAPGDRRKNVIELTANGKAIIDEMHQHFLGQDSLLKEGITDDELETCMGVLSKILRKCSISIHRKNLSEA